MTPINDRRSALAFVTKHDCGPLLAQFNCSAVGIANWILLNRISVEANELPAAAAEYHAERAAWLALGDDLDALLAPVGGSEDFEDGVSRRVVPELLARKVNQLRQTKVGRAVFARMLEALSTAAPPQSLWAGNAAENQVMSGFFLSVRPHLARVQPYLLEKYEMAWRRLSASELKEAEADSLELTLRTKALGDQNAPRALKNFLWMLADVTHGRYADAVRTQQLMARRINAVQAGAGPAPSRIRTARSV